MATAAQRFRQRPTGGTRQITEHPAPAAQRPPLKPTTSEIDPPPSPSPVPARRRQTSSRATPAATSRTSARASSPIPRSTSCGRTELTPTLTMPSAGLRRGIRRRFNTTARHPNPQLSPPAPGLLRHSAADPTASQHSQTQHPAQMPAHNSTTVTGTFPGD